MATIFNFLSLLVAEKPGKPDPPSIDNIGASTAGLSWKKPKEDGGAPITNYIIEYRVEGGFKWIKATEGEISRTSYTVKGLTEGNMYEFRVAAENKAGIGPFSDPTAPVEIYDKSRKSSYFNIFSF